jgi:hypothetical protein
MARRSSFFNCQNSKTHLASAIEQQEIVAAGYTQMTTGKKGMKAHAHAHARSSLPTRVCL